MNQQASISDSSTPLNSSASSIEPNPSSSSIKVLTSHPTLAANKYIDCLWSSLRPHGVEIAALNLNQPFCLFKAAHTSGGVVHLHWLDALWRYEPKKKVESLRWLFSHLRKLLFLKSRKYQFVWTVHNSISHECASPFIEKSFRWFIAKLCDDIVVMSEFSRSELAQLYGRTKQVHVIPHGNYIGVYSNQISRTEARCRLGIDPNQAVLLHLGMIRRYKGIDHLIAAVNQLKDPNIVLLIAGSPSPANLVTKIEQAAQQDSRIVLRLEFVPDEDVQLYMNACDWVVLPYQKMLNSGSILLALSFGRPVIVPQLGAIPELINDGEHGYCYAHNQDLVTGLTRALSTPCGQWEQMCVQSHHLAQQYDWSKIGSQIYQIYQRYDSSLK
jgi:beta-1,4-mannosyltransferase